MSDEAAETPPSVDPPLVAEKPPPTPEKTDPAAGDAESELRASAPTRSSAHSSVDDEATSYNLGRETLRPVDTTYIAGGRDQRVHIGDRIYVQGTRRGLSEPGEVGHAALVALRERYVAVPGYDVMLDNLAEHRLLVLIGPPGSGRTTTALRLLDEVTEGTVCRLEPDIDLRAVDDGVLGNARGCLAVQGRAAPQPTQAQADRLAAILTRQDSYCVVVAAPSPAAARAFVEYRAECASPPFTDLLKGHLDALLGPSGIDTVDELIALAEGPDLQPLIGPAPAAADVAEFAGVLVRHSTGSVSIEGVRASASAFLRRRVAQWFAGLGESPRRDGNERDLRITAVRIALAVFDGLPLHIVAATGSDLGRRLVDAVLPRIGDTRPVPVTFDPTLVTALGAELSDGDVAFADSSTPSQIARYRDRRAPSMVLTHIWQRHHELREPIIAWLAALSCHGERVVRSRAAQTTGLLAGVDFSHVFPALIEPAAHARPGRRRSAADEHGETPDDFDSVDESWELRRGFAAMAMDHAALDGRVTAVVEKVLRRWRRSSHHAARWTAARTLGLSTGPRSIETALDELRVIGTPWELIPVVDVPPQDRLQVHDLRWIAGLGVARLLATGDHHAVLREVDRWLRHRRRGLQDLARQTVVTMVELRQSAVSVSTPGSDRDAARDRWPVVLRLTEDDPTLREPVAALLRTVLEDGPAGGVLLDTLGGWWQLGQTDPEVLDALVRFVPYLIEGRRDLMRLNHSLRERCERWADPLSTETADRIRAAAAAVQGRWR